MDEDIKSGAASGGEMRFEAVVAKAEWDEIVRATKDAVGAPAIGRGRD